MACGHAILLRGSENRPISRRAMIPERGRRCHRTLFVLKHYPKRSVSVYTKLQARSGAVRSFFIWLESLQKPRGCNPWAYYALTKEIARTTLASRPTDVRPAYARCDDRVLDARGARGRPRCGFPALRVQHGPVDGAGRLGDR